MDEPPSQPFLILFANSGPYTALGLVSLILLAFLSAVIAASEVAFFSLSTDDVIGFQKSSDRREQLIARLLQEPKRLLATILIAANLTKVSILTIVAFFVLSNGWMDHKGWVLLIASIATFTITFLIEIIPKALASRHSRVLAAHFAGMWHTLMKTVNPLSFVLLAVTNFVQRKWSRTNAGTAGDNELTQTLEIVSNSEKATEDEKEILRGIVNFGALTVKQVMQSRVDVFAADASMDFHELLNFINKSGFSRLPVYKETIDKIEGVLYIKDLLPFIDEDEHFNWRLLLRPGFFVPETKKLDFLLKDFQEKRVHMALVVNEYGGLSGLITLEDVIEEIIGDINDEFDDIANRYRKIDEQTFVFEGKIPLHDFCKTLGIDVGIFDKIKGESESLGGLILEISHGLPSVGKKINFDQFTFTIEAVDSRRIKRIRVHIHEQKLS